MRNKILILGLMALLFPLVASAQEGLYDDYYSNLDTRKKRTKVQWGITAGPGAWIYDTTVELYDVKGSIGWHAGLQWAIVWDNIALEADIRYGRHRVTLTPKGEAYQEVDMSSNSLEVPILVSFRPGIFRINFGPVFHALESCKHAMADGTLIDFGCVRPTVGFTVGAGVQLGRHWLIDLRYNGDFSAPKGVFYDGGPEVSIRQHVLQLSVGFVL